MSPRIVELTPPSELSDFQIETLGNIDSLPDQYHQTYRFIRRTARPVGLLVHPSICLKLYHMLRENAVLPENLVSGLEAFIWREIDGGNIEPKQGMGFAILSQGFLSVNVWGRGNVLFTQTYTVEAQPPELAPEPLAKTGVACTWEAMIMGHEYELWHAYLQSPMHREDKLRYLTTFIEGNLF